MRAAASATSPPNGARSPSTPSVTSSSWTIFVPDWFRCRPLTTANRGICASTSWRDPRVVLGASDAGAHLDLLATFDWATRFLALARDMGVMPVEEAVQRITGVQADLYGLTDRGHIGEGTIADLVLFDPASIGPGRVAWRDDLPGGAGRLYGEAAGIERVFVDGREIVDGGNLTGDQPGHVLRSGRDTR